MIKTAYRNKILDIQSKNRRKWILKVLAFFVKLPVCNHPALSKRADIYLTVHQNTEKVTGSKTKYITEHELLH